MSLTFPGAFVRSRSGGEILRKHNLVTVEGEMESEKTRSTFEKIGRTIDELRGRIAELQSEVEKVTHFSHGAGGPAQKGPALAAVTRAVRRLTSAETVDDILSSLLLEAQRYVPRCAMFLQQDDSYVAYGSVAFKHPLQDRPVRIHEMTDPVCRAGRDQQLLLLEGPSAQLVSWLGDQGDLPAHSVCLPLVFKDTVPLVLYGDSPQPIDIDSLEVLTLLATLIIQNHHLAYLAQPVDLEDSQRWPALELVEESYPAEDTSPLAGAGLYPVQEAEIESPSEETGDLTAVEAEAPAEEPQEPSVAAETEEVGELAEEQPGEETFVTETEAEGEAVHAAGVVDHGKTLAAEEGAVREEVPAPTGEAALPPEEETAAGVAGPEEVRAAAGDELAAAGEEAALQVEPEAEEIFPEQPAEEEAEEAGPPQVEPESPSEIDEETAPEAVAETTVLAGVRPAAVEPSEPQPGAAEPSAISVEEDVPVEPGPAEEEAPPVEAEHPITIERSTEAEEVAREAGAAERIPGQVDELEEREGDLPVYELDLDSQEYFEEITHDGETGVRLQAEQESMVEEGVAAEVPTGVTAEAEILEEGPAAADQAAAGQPQEAAAEGVGEEWPEEPPTDQVALPAEEETGTGEAAPEETEPPAGEEPELQVESEVEEVVPGQPAEEEFEPSEEKARTEEEETLHNEARRFARLLVAEIKLYNEDEVIEGRGTGDLYERLKEDIDRSRSMYEKRAHPKVQSRFDYFHSEMVRVLALEDPASMGEGYPGPQLKEEEGESEV